MATATRRLNALAESGRGVTYNVAGNQPATTVQAMKLNAALADLVEQHC